MDAAGLQHGFRVGDWLIEPSQSRASSGDQAVTLTDDQLQVLLVLARRHGEAVDRRSIRSGLWPGQPGTEERLRAVVAELRAMFGEKSRQPRYIASVGTDAYALIAHFELLAPYVADASPANAGVPTGGAEPVGGRAGALLVELRRRNVLKVTASYLVGMWIVLQVAEVTFAPLRFPEWWMTALTIVAIVGLPIVAALAWAYEITPEGVVLDTGPGSTGVLPRLPRARQSIAPVIVAGVVAMAAVTGFAWWRSLDVPVEPTQATNAAPEPGARSIAVLPLVDMSPAGGNAFLGDGLSEELSTKLAQVVGLRVAARTSAFEFKGRNVDVRKIGQSLGVRHVLEGSVRRDGDNVRVTVQLIDTATGFHVWAGNFDRAWRDVLELQDDIAVSVTDALQVVLREKDGPTKPGHQVAASAIEPYLAGLAALRQPGDLSVLDQAEAAFTQAIERDPEFAGAYAGLCRTHARRFTRTRDPASRDESEHVCREALALDPESIETEKALASIALSAGKFGSAAKVYAGMLQRNPSDADAYIGLGDALAGLGKGAEAEANYRRAVRAEPAYWGAYTALGKHLFERGKVDEAAAAQRKATELMPSSAALWSNLGGILQLKGDFAGALEAYQRSLQIEPSKDAYSNLGTAYFLSSRFPEAVANYERAAALGEHDYQIQGNLADALWQVDGRRDDAQARYRRAILLAEDELQATPAAPALRAQLGYFYSRVGDTERSQRYLADALAAGPDMLYVQYFAGIAAADAGKRETALEAVRELVRMGYPPSLLRSAPEFRSLLQDAEYKKIVGGEG